MSPLVRTVRRIESDRRRIERDGIALAGRAARVAFRHAAAAVRLGHDPVKASRDVLIGNPAIHQRGLSPILAQTMLLADLRGRRRTMLQASGRVQPGMNLSAADEVKRRKREEELLIGLLLLDDDDLFDLRKTYIRQAQKMIGTMVEPLLDRIQETVKELAAQNTRQLPSTEEEVWRSAPVDPGEVPAYPPLKIPDVIRRVGEDYAKAGVIPGYEHSIDRTFETGGVDAYERGRRSGWDEPAVKDALWGFHYSAILDNRTTNLCRSLDGTVAPIDDPFWIIWRPPNHFFCRSCALEVWKSSALRQPKIIQPDATADDFERFRALKQKFLTYF